MKSTHCPKLPFPGRSHFSVHIILKANKECDITVMIDVKGVVRLRMKSVSSHLKLFMIFSFLVEQKTVGNQIVDGSH